MRDNDLDNLTEHAMLVAWGQFAQSLGLVDDMEAVAMHQKAYIHRPQSKVIEFLVAILAGFPYLKDISHSAHPLDQDRMVARAWKQAGWADYSGVSRTLTELTMEEAQGIERVLLKISQPIIDREVLLAVRTKGELVYDGDLTSRKVSNTSKTYPNAAYGHMSDDRIGLGYQAAMVSMESPTYGRLWLSAVLHPGNTLSCTQAEALVLAAETRTGMRPKRRTELLAQRLRDLALELTEREERLHKVQQARQTAQEELDGVKSQVQQCQQQVSELETAYQQHGHLERPFSSLGQARIKLRNLQARLERKEKRLAQAQRSLSNREALLAHCQTQQSILQERLQRFESDNAANSFPIRAVFRLDGGFGNLENLALLIESGYEIYLKSYGSKTTERLKRQVIIETEWERVGVNASLVAWANQSLKGFPYLVDIALERFRVEKGDEYHSLIHFGQDPTANHLQDWFHRYNQRQIIEAGIKEGKSTFEMHHLKVRSAAALFLQEKFAIFAANFVRWADQWLSQQCPQLPHGWQDSSQPNVKEQVKVGANTSAWVSWSEQGCLLRFTDHSVFAGRSLPVHRSWAYQMVLPFAKNSVF